jgi:hypothetical protein
MHVLDLRAPNQPALGALIRWGEIRGGSPTINAELRGIAASHPEPGQSARFEPPPPRARDETSAGD